MAYLSQAPQPTAAIDLTEFHCDFSENASAVIERMVKVDPFERYGSVDEVLADLGYDRRVSLPPPEDIALRSPVLVVESGTNRGARTVLGLENEERRVFGRAEIAGNDRSISRRHLEFSRFGDRYFVRDLNSKNGALLRGLALDPAGPAVEIQHTDRIKVGDVFLRFVFLRED
jgi:serine/threonine-protein kinase